LVKEVEREKLTYFALVYKQSTLTIVAPADNAEQKKFLGYDWSNRKGAEGIQINQPGGMLYNDSNRYDNDTLAAAVRHSFNDRTISLPDTLEKYYAYLRTQDMLDFSRTTFNKAIKLTADKKIEIVSKYPLVKLGEICNMYQPKTISGNEIKEKGKYKVFGANGVIGFYEEYNHENAEVAMTCRGATCGTINMTEPKSWITGNAMVITPKEEKKVLKLYLKNYLSYTDISHIITGSAQPQITKANLSPLQIPLPPSDIQQKIVSECEKVDEKYNSSRMSIEEYKKKIETEINGVEGQKKSIRSLCSVINPSKSAIRDIPNDTDVSFVDMPSISNDGFIEVKTDKPLGELRKGSYTYFAENDIIIAKITPCMENGKCAIAKDLTNGIGMGSSEFHVFRCDTSKINTEFMFAFLNRDVVRKEAEKRMTGASGHRRVPISFYENLEMPIPTLSDQQRIVSEIESYEAEIAKAKAVMAGCAERKKQILEKWLR
jgi:restriction endonuclease S subunit